MSRKTYCPFGDVQAHSESVKSIRGTLIHPLVHFVLNYVYAAVLVPLLRKSGLSTYIEKICRLIGDLRYNLPRMRIGICIMHGS